MFVQLKVLLLGGAFFLVALALKKYAKPEDGRTVGGVKEGEGKAD